MAMVDVDTQKRIKALRKKLAQIEKLKEKSRLSPEEAEKVASEPAILKDIWALENGAPLEPEKPAPAPTPEEETKAEEAPPPPEQELEEPEPAEPPAMEPAEAEKRIKALKKKLAQIQKLKDRGGNFTPEESEKVASEPALEAEVTSLEVGLLEPEAKKIAMALQKKLNEIRKLKAKGGQLNPQEREKVSKASNLKRELDELLAARPVFKQPAKEKPPASAQVQAVQAPVQQKAATKEVAPAPRMKESMRERWEPPEDIDDFDDISGVPDVSAPYQPAVLSEDSTDFEEGFVTKQSKLSKFKAKAAEKAAAAFAAAAEAEAAEAAAAEAAATQALADAAAAAKAKAEAEKAAAVAAEKAKADAERAAAAEKAKAEAEAEQASAAAAAGAVAAEATQDDADEFEAWQQVITPGKGQLSPPAAAAPAAAAANAAPAAPAAPAAAAAAAAAVAATEASGEVSPEKRIKALRKKLAQVAKLKQRGGAYSPEEAQKIASEPMMEAEIRALEKGEPWPPVEAAAPVEEVAAELQQAVEEPPAPEQPAPAEPEEPEVGHLSPEEAQKRIRNVKKKLTQIARLKERGGAFTGEEQAKIDSERRLLAEVAALELIA